MSVTIDIAGLPPERIVFSPSPLAELGAALHALSEPAHHPGLHNWTTATACALKPDLADRLQEADFLWRTTRSDILLPPDPGATLAEDLDRLDQMPEEEFVTAALEISCAASYGRARPNPLHDPYERDRTRERAAARGPCQAAFVERVLADPPAVRAWLRRLFEDCEQAFFGDTWQRVRVQLAADARHKAEVLRRKGLAEALATVSPALTLDAERQRIVADKLATGQTTALQPGERAGITFVPTAFGWPHLLVLHAPGWKPVVHYPVGSPELPRPQALELVQRRLDAVSHPVRMNLCRTLSRGTHTTGELANAHGITAPEVSRHISVLKKAGLLTTRRRGRYVLHQLDLASVARLGSDFLEALLR
ncbi:DUF5937 family protein [Streptomyces buecherae]|uniref:Helix-turn-helix transcriptional regulator n=1 Tax=Streptomyces buecherae TaxID=2763006 RepID=A0A7H8N870_9ACTN|nr:DUF5937 family protein [Streptomyces buecherae]QKW50754.1 helix-turn-helix transcriptional regulator [Streptomyces buecherae]